MYHFSNHLHHQQFDWRFYWNYKKDEHKLSNFHTKNRLTCMMFQLIIEELRVTTNHRPLDDELIAFEIECENRELKCPKVMNKNQRQIKSLIYNSRTLIW